MALTALICSVTVTAQPIEVHVSDRATNQPTIAPEIYGQFAEHLGSCIYGGLWVGEDSEIPNEAGYRTDVLEALKALQVPVLRWPGGCFANRAYWPICRLRWRPRAAPPSSATYRFADTALKTGRIASDKGDFFR